MTDHILTRQKLKNIPKIETFESLLAQSTLSDIDKDILRMHYLQEKDFRFIGDTLGFSEASIKTRHKKALKKLTYII